MRSGPVNKPTCWRLRPGSAVTEPRPSRTGHPRHEPSTRPPRQQIPRPAPAASPSRSAPIGCARPPRRCASRSPPAATTRVSSRPTPTARCIACRSASSPRARRRARWPRASPASGPSRLSSPRADVTTPRPGRVLISEPELRTRIAELGRQIGHDYAGETPVLVGVLQGAFLFMADLVRAIPGDITTDFIGLASYGAGNRSSGQVRIVSDLAMPVENRHVVVVEDIVDTGLTISYLRRNLEARHPRSIRVCALVDKIERRQVDVRIEYVGFTIPNVFVVGYGFDFGCLYRNLPYVAALGEVVPA